MSPLRRFGAAALVAAIIVAPAFAGQGALEDDQAAGDDRKSESAPAEKPKRAPGRDWGLFVAPYGWLAGVSGTVVSGGGDIDIDAPFSDLAERTRGGFQVYFEVRHKKWFLAFDGTWATLGVDSKGNLLDIDVEVQQRIYDIRAGYEVHWKYLGAPSPDPKIDWRCRGVVDVFVGGRYFRTAPKVTITRPNGDSEVTSSIDSRVDPFIGLRVGWDMSYRWGIGFRGDIGGFGIGDAAQFTWQGTAQLGYRLSGRITIFGGYRWLSFDTVTGVGEDRNGQDLFQHGPVIGAGIKL